MGLFDFLKKKKTDAATPAAPGPAGTPANAKPSCETAGHRWEAMPGRWHEKCAVCGETRKSAFDANNHYLLDGRCIDSQSLAFISAALGLERGLTTDADVRKACEELAERLKGDTLPLKQGDLVFIMGCLIMYQRAAGNTLSDEDRRYFSVITLHELTALLNQRVPESEIYSNPKQKSTIAKLA